MAKKNLPNIPLYIGDWQKDCSALSMEAQGAWLQIVFKLFTNGKQETYKTSTKGLQNLWKKSKEECLEIIEEFEIENICDISVESIDTKDLYSFTCRRFVKENKLSNIRKTAVSNRKDRKKVLQNAYKTSTKHIQTPENENESVYDNDNKKKGVIGGKTKIDKTLVNQISDYFLQTREEQKIKVHIFLNSPEIQNQFEYFKTQFQSYVDYKKATGEKIHNWLSYQTEWNREDWSEKLKRLKNTTLKQNESAQKVTERMKQYD